jgi:hypothetical protein
MGSNSVVVYLEEPSRHSQLDQRLDLLEVLGFLLLAVIGCSLVVGPDCEILVQGPCRKNAKAHVVLGGAGPIAGCATEKYPGQDLNPERLVRTEA